MKPITNDQEAFDLCVKHLSQMTERCLDRYEGNDTDACSYWRDDGSRCAIGGIMPSEMARMAERTLGNTGTTDVDSLIHSSKPVKKYFKNCRTGLLISLQMVHDNAANWTDAGFVGQKALRRVAHQANLNTDVLDTKES